LHDHGDAWGSICVYTGRVRVTPYELAGSSSRNIWRFRPGDHIDAGRGATSLVIPPHDCHTIENPFGETAISIHVYKGEMETAGIYLPLEESGIYRREVKTLSYDPA
jgi:predicted metal-dependent enzyme (double-stranded beta helix superfamily)